MAVFEYADPPFSLPITLNTDAAPGVNSLIFGGWNIPSLTGTNIDEYEDIVRQLRSTR